MDFTLSQEQKLIQNIAREFAEKNIEPLTDQIDKENRVPDEIIQGLAELDFFGLPYPEKYSGADAGYDGYVLVMEQIARSNRYAKDDYCWNHPWTIITYIG